jgi:transposase
VLSLTLPGRIYLCLPPTDMRKSFDGLAAAVRAGLGRDPLSGDLFVFRNARGDRLKLLYWDRDGLAVWAKRLERGTFQFPAAAGAKDLEVTATDLAMILGGIDLGSARRRLRYRRPASRDTCPVADASRGAKPGA